METRITMVVEIVRHMRRRVLFNFSLQIGRPCRVTAVAQTLNGGFREIAMSA